MNTLSLAKPGLLPQVTHARNPGMALDLDWVASVQANTSAIERRAATLPGRRSVKKDYQAAWLLKAISLIDLTTLSGDDTEGRVQRLCAKARQPVRALDAGKARHAGLTTGAVCVYHEMVETAVRALEGTSIPVAAVSTGFPRASRPYPCASPKSAKASAPGRRRSTSSSPAAMCSRRTGRPSTTRCATCAPPAATPM
jgi:deoxyribose-phosphate aldolase